MSNEDDEDSDDSSSIPMGIPGGGALTFLPVQQSHNELPDENKTDNNTNSNESDSDSDSDSTPIGIPGGDDVLSFVAVQGGNTQNNNHDDNDNNDNNDNAAAPSSPSTSSSSSPTPMGIPGGDDLVFVASATMPAQNNDAEPDATQSAHNEEHKDESSSDSDSSGSPLGLPGGGAELTFYPPSMSQRNKLTNNNNDNNDNNNNNGGIDESGIVMVDANSAGHMNMLSYDEDPDEDEVLDVVNNLPQENEDDVDESSPDQPHMSMAQTVAVAKHTQQKPKRPKVHRKVNSSTLSDARREYEAKEQHTQNTAIWDIVYMTSSPLVCRSDFKPTTQPKLANSTTRRSAPGSASSGNDTLQTASFGDSKSANLAPKRSKKPLLPLELLDVSRESEEFINVVRSANRSLCVVHEIATTGNLIKAMAHKCRILHYSGHGFPSYLAFEDENSIGDTHMLQDIMFKKIVNKGDKLQLKFVFTSACHSEAVGKAFVSAGVPHVVSIDTKFEVSDEGAMTFTKYFYEALLCGRTIRDSFQLAKQSVQFISSSAKRDYEKFKLLPKKGNHDVCLFKNLHPGQLINQSQRLPPNTLPTTIKPFVGRSIDMRDIIHSFMAKKNESCRVLNIHGDGGVGKSAISIMVGRYLNDRKIYFKNGIYYVDCLKLITNHDATTFKEMLAFCVQKAFADYNNHNADLHPQDLYRYDSNMSLLTNLQLSCRLGALFIIDDIDQLIYYYKTNDIDVAQYLFDIMFKILSEVSDKIKFIIISKKICQEAFNHNANSQLSPKNYHLKRLSSTDASSLFSKLTGGQWRENDIKENIDIMSIMKNNPLQIHELAKLKNQWECQTLTKLADTYALKSKLQKKQGLISSDSNSTLHNQFMKKTQQKQSRQQLIKQYIKNPAAQQVWIKAHGSETCDYHKIFEVLKLEFTEYTFSKRKLQQNNLLTCFRDLGMNQDLTINVEKFDIIYAWFNGLTRLVMTLSDYYNQLNPIVIHGFVSREDAQQMLLQNKSIPIGTFIIRFRYKQPKSIAISYKQAHTAISNLKCDLSRNNDSTFICGQKLMPLPQFILSFPPLTYLYHPQKPIPKQQVFHAANHHNHQQQANNQALPSWNTGNMGRSWNPSPHSQQTQQFNAYPNQSQPQMHGQVHTHHPQQQQRAYHNQRNANNTHSQHHHHHQQSNNNNNHQSVQPSFSQSRSYNPQQR